MSTLCIASMWRNAGSSVIQRVDHLLSKTSSYFSDIEYLWAVGDCDDNDLTKHYLNSIARTSQKKIAVIDNSTGIVGEDLQSCRRRLAAAGNKMFAAIPPHADYVLLHESDLLTDDDVADQLLAQGFGEPCAGWPTIEITPGWPQFYDIYAYRHLDGRHFSSGESPPSNMPFRVSSFGSVFLAPAYMVWHRVMDERCIVSLCEQWGEEDIHMYVAPMVRVVQPVHLWRPL